MSSTPSSDVNVNVFMPLLAGLVGFVGINGFWRQGPGVGLPLWAEEKARGKFWKAVMPPQGREWDAKES